MNTVALILGTRPEIIKLAPLAQALSKSAIFKPFIISSGQHREMSAQAFSALTLKPDLDLNLMLENQSPNTFLGRLLPELQTALAQLNPAGVIVQGDTTTALGGALSAFHLKLPLGHVEAGLRTYDLHSPFPEEMNRTLISRLASLHFCPTQGSAKNLKNENCTGASHITGNTVVDALLWMKSRLKSGAVKIEPLLAELSLESKKFLLVTGHRRENLNEPLENLCKVLLRLADSMPDLEIVYPVHLNPNVQNTVYERLNSHPRIHLLKPLDYPSLIYLMQHAALIISDSGGIQEEAPTLGTRVLVTRDTTERPEALQAKTAELYRLQSPEELYKRAAALLSGPKKLLAEKNPFGDGTAAEQIHDILKRTWAE